MFSFCGKYSFQFLLFVCLRLQKMGFLPLGPESVFNRKNMENAFTSENKTLRRKPILLWIQNFHIWVFATYQSTITSNTIWGGKMMGKWNYRFLLCGRWRFSSSFGGLKITRKKKHQKHNRQIWTKERKGRWGKSHLRNLKLMNDSWRSVEEEEIQIPFLGQKKSGERRSRKTLKTSEEES